jgi:hypothetical protein
MKGGPFILVLLVGVVAGCGGAASSTILSLSGVRGRLSS